MAISVAIIEKSYFYLFWSHYWPHVLLSTTDPPFNYFQCSLATLTSWIFERSTFWNI